MGARQNFIIVVPRSWETVRRVLAALQSLIEERIGSLTTVSVQNFSTGSTDDRSIRAGAAESLPGVSRDELVAFYPSEPKHGSVIASHEGSYDLVVLSLGKHASTLDLLDRIWRVVGREADAVVAGEELEVDDDQIASLLESGEVPAELDLCDAAIAKLPSSLTGRNESGKALEHGGRLLVR